MIALLAWELGAGRGHLEHMKPVLAGLLGNGWTVVCAVRDSKTGGSFLSDAGGARGGGILKLVQAPVFIHRSRPFLRAPGSLAEILAHIGFADQSLLQPLFEDWSRIVDIVRPDVIIGDFAPSVAAVAQGRIPVIMTGNGWTIPPDGAFLPALPIRQYDQAMAMEAEKRICDAVEAASAGNWRPRSLAQLLRGDARFIYTSAVLDPYRYWRRDALSCPPNLTIPDSREQRPASHILLYLPKSHPSIDRALAALGVIGVPTYAFFGGEQPPAPSNVMIQPRPLDLPTLLPFARLVVHHGGLGTANWSLAYGKPQAVLATDLEKFLIGRAVASSRLGISIPPSSEWKDMIGPLQRALDIHSHQRLNGLVHKSPNQTVRAILQSCHDAV